MWGPKREKKTPKADADICPGSKRANWGRFEKGKPSVVISPKLFMIGSKEPAREMYCLAA